MIGILEDEVEEEGFTMHVSTLLELLESKVGFEPGLSKYVPLPCMH